MGAKPKWNELGDPSAPGGMLARANQFLEALRVAYYSRQTVQTRQKHLRPFLLWCAERGLTRPEDVTREALERYQRFLFHYRKENGQPLDAATQVGMLVSVRRLFQWLARAGHLPFNPASELELPRTGQRLPRHVLTPAEVEQVLAQPDVGEVLGLRDRALLEVFYSTGVRRMELLGLQLADVDAARGVVLVRRGKGDKDRTVPIGERALAWVAKYVEVARPKLLTRPEERTLFLTKYGGAFTPSALTYVARQHVEAAELGKVGSCHMFRHAMATAMLENGADIRFIQELLGHAQLSSTEVYTRVAITKLKQVHAATHPAAKLERPSPRSESAVVDPREALLAVLETEGDEER